jgi:hypothetical protein
MQMQLIIHAIIVTVINILPFFCGNNKNATGNIIPMHHNDIPK